MECFREEPNIVKLGAKLFTPSRSLSSQFLASIDAWKVRASFILVKGLRLYFETNCPLEIESFDDPLRDCYRHAASDTMTTTQPRANITNGTTIALAVIVSILGAILGTIVVLVIYFGWRRSLRKNTLR